MAKEKNETKTETPEQEAARIRKAKTMITDEELDHWLALADAATEGPLEAVSGFRYAKVKTVYDGVPFECRNGRTFTFADAEFFAASREAVPRLIAALRAERGSHGKDMLEVADAVVDHANKRITQLEAERDELRAEVERLRNVALEATCPHYHGIGVRNLACISREKLEP